MLLNDAKRYNIASCSNKNLDTNEIIRLNDVTANVFVHSYAASIASDAMHLVSMWQNKVIDNSIIQKKMPLRHLCTSIFCELEPT